MLLQDDGGVKIRLYLSLSAYRSARLAPLRYLGNVTLDDIHCATSTISSCIFHLFEPFTFCNYRRVQLFDVLVAAVMGVHSTRIGLSLPSFWPRNLGTSSVFFPLMTETWRELNSSN